MKIKLVGNCNHSSSNREKLVMGESGVGGERVGAPVSGDRRRWMVAGVGSESSFSVPGMRHSPLTRGRKRDPDRLLPFRFSSWITPDFDELTLPDVFGEVHWRNCPSPAKIRFTKSGTVYSVVVGIDLSGRCIMAEGFRDFISSIEAGEGDRLDFTYNGKGKFEVSIGDDAVKTMGERPYTVWEEALEEVRRRLR